MQRYFGHVMGKDVLLSSEDAFHLTRVMRARIDEQIEVVDSGTLYLCTVKNLKPLQIEVVKQLKEEHELQNDVILIASLLKGEKMDWVLQKATELGVSEIVLIMTERTIVRIKYSDKEVKFERYRKILKEAAEQSKRTVVPALFSLTDLDHLSDIQADVKMIAYEADSGSTKSFYNCLKSIKPEDKIAIIIGPEGGFSEEEVKKAEEQGYKRVSLGKRILRAETASFYALSVIGNYLENK